MFILASRVNDYLQEALKPSNIARPVITFAFLYSLATTSRSCTTLPASSVSAVPEGQPAATEVMGNNEGDIQEYEAIPTETSIPTKESTPTTSPEQIEREEILERLKHRNLALTDEEMKEVMPFEDKSIQDRIELMRKYSYHDMPFVYIIFTDNDNAGISRFSPFNFPQIDALVDFDFHDFDNKEISYFLTALTSKYKEEGWDGQIDNPVYVTKDRNGNICFGLRQSKDTEGIGFIKNTDGSYNPDSTSPNRSKHDA